MATVTNTRTTLGFCTGCGAEMPAGAAFCPGCGARVEPLAPPPPAAGPVPAGLPTRGAAYVLDFLLLLVAMWVVLGTVSRFAGDSGVGLAGIFVLGAGQLYWALLESGPRRASIGKRALKLVVVNVDGTRVTLNRALMRSALSVTPLVVALVCAFAGALDLGGFLMAFVVPAAVLMAPFTLRRQALHDKLTQTMVARGAGA